MADIAQIGFAADTSALADAKTKIEQLSPAAGKAERASERLAKMLNSVDAAADKLVAATNGLSAATDKLSAIISGAANSNSRNAKATLEAAAATQKNINVSVAATDALQKETASINKATEAKKRYNSVPLISPKDRPNPWGGSGGNPPANDNMPNANGAKFNTANIAAQFQDVGVTAAMGMNPLMIALQQGTQLSAVLQTMEKPLKGIAAAFTQILNPVSLLTIAVIALVAAGLQMINWTKLAQTALNGLATAIEVLGPYVLGLAATLSLIYAPQIIMGIVTLIAWIARMGVAATIAGAQMAASWIIAGGPLVWLIAGIAAVATAAIVFRDELAQLFGFDIVGSAKTGINTIIAVFVGGFNSISKVWAKLPALMGDIVAKVANAVVDAIQNMINASVRGINSLISLLPAGLQDMIGLSGGIGDGIDLSDYRMKVTGAASEIGSIIRGEIDSAMGQDYIGQLANGVTNMLGGVATKIRQFSDTLDDPKKSKKKGGKTDGEKFEDIVNGADRTIAALKAERDAIGMNEEAAARLKHQTDLLNQAKQKNIELSDPQREKLMQLGAEMANLEINIKRAKEALDFAKDATKGFFQDFIEGIKNGETVWQSFGKAALNVLNKIGAKLLDLAVNDLFSGGNSSGGFLRNLFNVVGNLFGARYEKGGMPSGIGAYSNSIVSTPTLFPFAAGVGLMGEAGPEAIMPIGRGPDGTLGVHMFGNGSESAAANNNVEIHNSYYIEGAISNEDIISMVKQSAETTMQETKKSIVGWMDQYGQDGAFA